MSTETRIAEIDQRLIGVEKDISEILPRSKDYTDSKFREVKLQMVINTGEIARKTASELKAELKKDAWGVAKLFEWAFKLGMIATLGWISVNQAQAILL